MNAQLFKVSTLIFPMKRLDGYEYQEHWKFFKGNKIRLVPLKFEAEIFEHNWEILTEHNIVDLMSVVGKHAAEGWQPDDELRLYIHKAYVESLQSKRMTVKMMPVSYIYEARGAASEAVDSLLESRPITPVETITDLGMGDGSQLRRILNRVDHQRVLGFDIRQPEPQPGITYVKADLNDTVPLKDDSVDLCCMVDMFGQFALPPRGIREAVRITRPGGYILIADRNMTRQYPEQNADLLQIDILESKTVPVKVEEHPYPAREMVDRVMATSPELGVLTADEQEGIRRRLLQKDINTVILPYTIDYSCVLAQKK